MPVDVLGGSLVDWAVRSDELAFRNWAEPQLLNMAKDSPKALVYLDCGSLVEPGWLGPLVAAVAADPHVMAVPDIVHFGSLEGGHAASSGNLVASAGGQFDLALNYYVQKPASEPSSSGAAGASLKGDSSSRTGDISSSNQARASRVQKVGATSLAAFAVHSDWWAALGGFEVAVSAGLGLGFWPSDLAPLEASASSPASSQGQVSLPGAGAPALELSLRHWGCGGAIHVVPCSVVQRQSGRGAGSRQPTQAEVHAASTAALKVAELWMAALAPSVWASHGEPLRSPLAMTRQGIDATARESLAAARNRLGSQGQCKGLEWFLEHVDPELFLADRSHLLGVNHNNNHIGIGGSTHEAAAAGAPAAPALPAFPTGAACKDHPDYAASCAGWAALNECTKNPAFMVLYCPRACGGCGGAPYPGGVTGSSARDAGFYPHKEAVAFAHAPAASSSSSNGGNVKAAAEGGARGEGAHVHGDDLTYQDLPPRRQADDHTVAHASEAAAAGGGSGGAVAGSAGANAAREGGAGAAAASKRDPAYWLSKDHGPAPTDPAIVGSTWPPPDPRWLSRRRLDAKEPSYPPRQPEAACNSKDGHATLLKQVEVSPDNTDGHTVFCMVYTIAKAHKGGPSVVRDTWASRCDGFAVMSTEEDASLPAIHVTHEGPEEYNNIWQKVRSIWKYVYHAYGQEFDWFYIGGDDLFIIPENLRAYLTSPELVEAGGGSSSSSGGEGSGGNPLFLGRRFQIPRGQLFNSGGAGYALNRAALKLLFDHLDNPKCFPHQKVFAEDVNVARCLSTFGVVPYDTRDKTAEPAPNGAYPERFHPFTPGQHMSWQPPRRKNADGSSKDWYENYNAPWGVAPGKDCCSKQSATFHYVKPDLMPKLSALLWDCRAPLSLKSAVK